MRQRPVSSGLLALDRDVARAIPSLTSSGRAGGCLGCWAFGRLKSDADAQADRIPSLSRPGEFFQLTFQFAAFFEMFGHVAKNRNGPDRMILLVLEPVSYTH